MYHFFRICMCVCCPVSNSKIHHASVSVCRNVCVCAMVQHFPSSFWCTPLNSNGFQLKNCGNFAHCAFTLGKIAWIFVCSTDALRHGWNGMAPKCLVKQWNFMHKSQCATSQMHSKLEGMLHNNSMHMCDAASFLFSIQIFFFRNFGHLVIVVPKTAHSNRSKKYACQYNQRHLFESANDEHTGGDTNRIERDREWPTWNATVPCRLLRRTNGRRLNDDKN